MGRHAGDFHQSCRAGVDVSRLPRRKQPRYSDPPCQVPHCWWPISLGVHPRAPVLPKTLQLYHRFEDALRDKAAVTCVNQVL